MGNSTGIIVFSSNKTVQNNLHNILSEYYVAKIVSQREKLFEIISENKNSVVFIDSDIELCEKIKSLPEYSEISLILISSSGSELHLNEISKSSADLFFEYPFSKNELLPSVKYLLNETKQKKHLHQINNVTKESEQKYKRLFQLSPDAMGYHVGGKIGFINEAGIKILGANSFDEVFGKFFLDFIHPFDREFTYEKIKITEGNKPLNFETRLITLDGRTKYIDVVSTNFILGGVNAVQFILRDITDKKLNESNLLESKSRLEFVQKIAKLGYWEYDLKNNKLLWSKEIYELFGLEEKEFPLNIENFVKLIHPDDRKTFREALNVSFTGIVSLDIEHRIVKEDNQITYIHHRGTVIYNEKGDIEKFSGSIQDITDRKVMENAIRESQSRLSNIINSAMDAVITVDENQDVVLFNVTAEKMFNCSSSDAIGKSIDRFIPARYREIHKIHISSFGETGITMRSMGAINPISGLRTTGEEFPIEASISQVEVNGHKLYTVIIRDITEKKKSEEALISSEARYRLLFQKNPLPMWVFDLETLKIMAVNFAAVKIYGYSKDEFLSMTIMNIRPEEDVDALKSYLSTPRNPLQNAGIWRHRKKNGTIIDVEVISHEIEFDGRQARLVLANDITEKIKAEDDLKNSREQLRDLAAYLQNIREEERSAIAREIHDELGQVLTSLKMNLIFVDKKITNTEKSISMDEIHNEITGMTGTIDDSVKRVRKIITELRPEMLDQLGLIPAIEWQTNEFKTKSGIDCNFVNNFGETEVNRNISIAVYRILQEALTNVMRHSQASKVDVKIGRSNNHLKLDICDNGVGIKPKKNKSKSFGVIGMKERAIILGGEFKVENNQPSGTKIQVYIPLDKS